MATQKEIDYQLAHIDEDRSVALIVSHTICLVLAGFAIVLRLIARRMSKAAIKADDYMIIVAFVSGPSAERRVLFTSDHESFMGICPSKSTNEPCLSLP